MVVQDQKQPGTMLQHQYHMATHDHNHRTTQDHNHKNLQDNHKTLQDYHRTVHSFKGIHTTIST